MSIQTPPPPIVRSDGSREVTLKPVAFRPSVRHSWRSYEVGNPRYKHDFAKHFYTTTDETRDLVLYVCESRLVGMEYETHCAQCGAYTVVVFPKGVMPKEPRILCVDCITSNTSLDLPQNDMRYYAPEYQAQLQRALSAPQVKERAL